MQRCPGQNQQFWSHEDIYYIICPNCNSEIEFWKDEPYHACSGCNKVVKNPKIDTGCARWCKYADECLTGIMKS